MSDSFVAPWTVARQDPHPWNSSGKNTGVDCHFQLLLQINHKTQRPTVVYVYLSLTRSPKARGHSGTQVSFNIGLLSCISQIPLHPAGGIGVVERNHGPGREAIIATLIALSEFSQTATHNCKGSWENSLAVGPGGGEDELGEQKPYFTSRKT